jgi:gas vesicle protein
MLFKALAKKTRRIGDKKMSDMSDNRDMLLTFVLGGLIGVALGVLYAPKSGREMRSSIKKFGEEIVGTVNDLGNDFKENESQFYE